jgi:hypothetical protein
MCTLEGRLLGSGLAVWFVVTCIKVMIQFL